MAGKGVYIGTEAADAHVCALRCTIGGSDYSVTSGTTHYDLGKTARIQYYRHGEIVGGVGSLR